MGCVSHVVLVVMRILHVSTRLILGGSQENTVLSCEGQARLGHEVHLAFGPIYGPEGSLLGRVEAFNERCSRGEERTASGEACRPICMHVVPNLVREVRPIADARCYGELKRLIASLRPDVVHTHSSKAGILGRAAAHSQRAKGPKGQRRVGQEDRERAVAESSDLAIWPFGHMAICHTIHGPPFMPVEGSPVRRAKVRMANLMYVLAERYAARRCDAIISVADAMTALFLSHRIGRPEQYVTVRSGMEVESFLHARPGETREEVRRELGLAPSDFVVGTVARLAEHKGHDDILDALGDDLRAHADWKLLWVGDGWWRDRLLARVEAMGLRDRVVTTGLVPQERVPAMMRAMDVLAHPSYREGLPRTVPQALLCGVVPVAYDVDGTREVCRSGETGVLVPLRDLGALRAGVVRLYESPEERRRLAERGREMCRVEFSAERMVRDLERVYQSVRTAH
ncbi:MAG TPA: glycosyltransferase [Phycisphaerales bacterium]|nr:glycosyltransferase [Phycisphaerales bacterium]